MNPGDGLAGRRVVIFGSTGALGRVLARAFVDAGAAVIGGDYSPPSNGLEVPGVAYHALDVLDEGAVVEFFASVQTPWAVINTIGGFAAQVPIAELDVEVFQQQLDLNVRSAALITKHALRAMSANGEGRIVHTSSRAAVRTAGNGFAYSSSKLAVNRLVEMAAADVHGTGLTVNCIMPSIIDTPANRQVMPDMDFSHWPKPHELAQIYLFLASPASGLISGAAIPAYGRF